MNKQDDLEAILSLMRPKGTSPFKGQPHEQEPAPYIGPPVWTSPLLSTLGLQASSRRTPSQTQPTSESLADQFARGVAVFPKIDRVVVNEAGAFIPRSIFGYNVEIKYEKKRAANGAPLITIFSVPRNQEAVFRLNLEPVNRRQELRWLADNRKKYAGQWVAIEGDSLLSHGTDAIAVYEEARTKGIKSPFVVQVEPLDELPFGGW